MAAYFLGHPVEWGWGGGGRGQHLVLFVGGRTAPPGSHYGDDDDDQVLSAGTGRHRNDEIAKGGCRDAGQLIGIILQRNPVCIVIAVHVSILTQRHLCNRSNTLLVHRGARATGHRVQIWSQ